MGTWGTNIKENDTSGDIFDSFFELYNAGQNPVDISAKLISDNTELIDNPDDCNNFWFCTCIVTMGDKIIRPRYF